MFLDFWVEGFLSFFAIYGLVQTIINIFSYIGDRRVFKDKTVYTVVAVKNEENRVENIVHSLLLKVLKDDNGAYNRKISVIDLGSTDKTMELLEILKNDKPYLNVYSIKEFVDEIKK
ncbi:MAG: hypothetical protein E7405_02215 [Ruminococcaceae bacterium]|nr:hypothetical protein [Oscillospiraceae bacterium]